MLLLGDVARQVFAFVGRPNQNALPERDLIDAGSREVKRIVVDLLNADRDYRAELVTVNPAGRDTLFLFGEIARLEAREAGSADEGAWVEWQRASYGSFDGGGQFATYGGMEGTHLVLSEDPGAYEFRALVESGGVTLSALTDDTTLSDLVEPLLFNRWALSAGAMVDSGKTADPEGWERQWARKERRLSLDQPALERQWKAYTERVRGAGIAYKEGFASSGRSEFEAVYVDGAGNLRAG
jgi:hypothetical protein